MSDDFLKERRESLEEAFFHKESQEKLAAMKDRLASETDREELKKASGMSDDEVLDHLMAVGLRASTVAALSLVPLVHVAWADGKIQADERAAILQAAESKHISKNSDAWNMLDGWLANKPEPVLFNTWKEYIEALSKELLTGRQMDSVKTQIVGFARGVAEAAGGFLGVSTVSGSEERALDEIAAAFPG